jgi:hypothetical protein
MAKMEFFSLSEFKEHAKTLGYTKIERQAEDAHDVPLESWNGVTLRQWCREVRSLSGRQFLLSPAEVDWQIVPRPAAG